MSSQVVTLAFCHAALADERTHERYLRVENSCYRSVPDCILFQYIWSPINHFPSDCNSHSYEAISRTRASDWRHRLVFSSETKAASGGGAFLTEIVYEVRDHKYADNPSLKSHNPGAFESRLLWRRFEFDCEVPWCEIVEVATTSGQPKQYSDRHATSDSATNIKWILSYKSAIDSYTGTDFALYMFCHVRARTSANGESSTRVECPLWRPCSELYRVISVLFRFISKIKTKKVWFGETHDTINGKNRAILRSDNTLHANNYWIKMLHPFVNLLDLLKFRKARDMMIEEISYFFMDVHSWNDIQATSLDCW